MFTCVIQYEVDPSRIAEFRDYARAWIGLIEKYGGTHHGFFSPPTAAEKPHMPDPAFSFEGLGASAPPNRGFALFSFASVAAYESYRARVADDPACIDATARFEENSCFLSYQRSFTTPVRPE